MPRQTRVSRVPPPENQSGAGRQNTASGQETQQRVVQGRGRPRAPATAAVGTPVNELRRAGPSQSTSRTSVPVLAGGGYFPAASGSQNDWSMGIGGGGGMPRLYNPRGVVVPPGEAAPGRGTALTLPPGRHSRSIRPAFYGSPTPYPTGAPNLYQLASASSPSAYQNYPCGGSGYSRDARMQMRGSRPIGITGLSPVMRGRGGVSTRAPRPKPQIHFSPPPEIKVPTEPPEMVTLSDDDDTSITSKVGHDKKPGEDSDSSSDVGRYSPSSSTSSNVSDGKAAVSQLFKALTKVQKKKEPNTLMCRDGVAQCQSSDSDTESSPNKASKTFSFAFGDLLPIMEEGATGERGVVASQTYIDELQVLSAQLAIEGLSKNTTSGAGPSLSTIPSAPNSLTESSEGIMTLGVQPELQNPDLVPQHVTIKKEVEEPPISTSAASSVSSVGAANKDPTTLEMLNTLTNLKKESPIPTSTTLASSVSSTRAGNLKHPNSEILKAFAPMEVETSMIIPSAPSVSSMGADNLQHPNAEMFNARAPMEVEISMTIPSAPSSSIGAGITEPPNSEMVHTIADMEVDSSSTNPSTPSSSVSSTGGDSMEPTNSEMVNMPVAMEVEISVTNPTTPSSSASSIGTPLTSEMLDTLDHMKEEPPITIPSAPSSSVSSIIAVESLNAEMRNTLAHMKEETPVAIPSAPPSIVSSVSSGLDFIKSDLLPGLSTVKEEIQPSESHVTIPSAPTSFVSSVGNGVDFIKSDLPPGFTTVKEEMTFAELKNEPVPGPSKDVIPFAGPSSPRTASVEKETTRVLNSIRPDPRECEAVIRNRPRVVRELVEKDYFNTNVVGKLLELAMTFKNLNGSERPSVKQGRLALIGPPALTAIIEQYFTVHFKMGQNVVVIPPDEMVPLLEDYAVKGPDASPFKHFVYLLDCDGKFDKMVLRKPLKLFNKYVKTRMRVDFYFCRSIKKVGSEFPTVDFFYAYRNKYGININALYHDCESSVKRTAMYLQSHYMMLATGEFKMLFPDCGE